MDTARRALPRRARIARGARASALLAGDLFLRFLAAAAFRAALLAEQGIASAPVAPAAGKALMLGKVLLLGEAVPLGATLRRSMRLLVLRLALPVAEEVLRALIKRRTGLAAPHGDVTRRHRARLASLALPWPILLPSFGLQQIAGRLGPEAWPRVRHGDP